MIRIVSRGDPRTAGALARRRRRLRKAADVAGLRVLASQAAALPAGDERDRLLSVIAENVRSIEAKLVAGIDPRPLRKRIGRRAKLLVAAWIVVWIAATASLDRGLLRPYAIGHRPVPPSVWAVVGVVVLTLGFAGGFAAARPARLSEVALLALAAGLVLYFGISSLAEAYNGPVPAGGEDENPFQTGVLVIAGLVPAAVSIAAGRAARIFGGRLRRRRPT